MSSVNIETSPKEVFIIGSKGIPAKYGGFETFVEKLTDNKKSKNLIYHVACGTDEIKKPKEFIYNNAKCFEIKRKKIGSAKAVLYDIDSLKWVLKYILKYNIENPIIYILACRMGPFISYYKKKIEKVGGMLFVNPDGHEWERKKWNKIICVYWKFSEKMMIKYSDLVICDSKTIETYIQSEYKVYSPKTTYIAYGAEIEEKVKVNSDFNYLKWYTKKEIKPFEYYLVVGRFVPENNYEIIIREFMKSKTAKKLVLITNVNKEFLSKLEKRTNFRSDSRIKFVGTVYEQKLLKSIRENAYGYLHGHEVGGTNPSLLEALAATKLNLILDVGFNREVAEGGALYWNKKEGSLTKLINRSEKISKSEIETLSEIAKKRILWNYNWNNIVEKYENVFLHQNSIEN
ncbi:beta 1-4 rhamnosyltransferase Cps2T [Eubacterium callanderi]|uniref:beta 1-4 rhamnosyltransferase Cps2T n=1 Tax=Eubacterium callanderi TaxID=53442 RepID=UPI001C10E240|nr:DUF1972 domain-containing protein [Eubacterium callanderi]MBU5305036.1 DUF1972 domain-containing protein [Eubacterium callanderi]